ncbi:flagellar L-ring protein precursor FlgH [Sphingomonas sp. SORGH_AS802]|uniref:flagellar basal body L-ring protein FlgH n=1 Tax=unclassified Sphingomonas TaxID=196159 RepID=UPI0028561540|nr:MULTISPECIES: flagellar basal body L-ring protein FlgH [unclassified Sphingomonas]MDR6128292.1 flagellar L-ring protein precursor FlgH [Sphingomonas sp. SORGH_AS_0438]MDR6135504.1 flagellar L-ring protein precursor FlgH [Sphingomonas sp. SORGH_AS_0802]
MSPRLALVPIVVLALAPAPSQAGLFGKKAPPEDFSAARAAPPVVLEPATGSIFAASQGYAALYEGWRARRVGDPLTIVLVEQTAASKSASSKLDSQGSGRITPPATGLLNLFPPSSATASGARAFNGTGAADQANSLSGEVSVTVAEVYPNGTMLVQGQKRLTLNRGDEYVRIKGIVRTADVDRENRVLSTRVADAQIAYTGKGDVARASRQGWLSRFFSVVSPF